MDSILYVYTEKSLMEYQALTQGQAGDIIFYLEDLIASGTEPVFTVYVS